jgi:hypothetical protein
MDLPMNQPSETVDFGKRRTGVLAELESRNQPPVEFDEPATSNPLVTVPVEGMPPEPPHDDAETYEMAPRRAAPLPDLN